MIDKEVIKFVVKVVSSSDGKPAFLEAMFFFFRVLLNWSILDCV